LLDASTGKTIRNHSLADHNVCTAVVFGPNGRELATGGWHDASIFVWDVASGKKLRALKGDGQEVKRLALSADGKVLVSLTWAGQSGTTSIGVWDPTTGKRLRKWHKTSDYLDSPALSGDGRLVASGGTEGNVWLWQVASGKVLHRFNANERMIFTVALSPDGRLAEAGGHDITLWEVATRRQVARFQGHEGAVHSLAFSRRGRRLVSGSADTTALVWDLTGRLADPKSFDENQAAKHLERWWEEPCPCEK
jgi:WD40 repeat protein